MFYGRRFGTCFTKMGADLELTRLVAIETLQKLQDRFAVLGRVTVCLRTVDGRPVTEPTWGSRFSELIGTSLRGRREFAVGTRACAVGANDQADLVVNDGMTLYATPIEHDGASLAVIVVGTRDPVPPGPQAVTLLAEKYDVDCDELLESTASLDPYSGGAPTDIRQFADTLAETIATMYGQARRIERQLADLRTVHELSQRLADKDDVQDILDATVRRVVEVMPVKACGIRLLKEDTGELVIKAVCNLSAEYLQKGPVTLHDNAIDTAAVAGKTVYVENVQTDPRTRYPDNARREGIVSGLCVPMTYRGQTVGVIRAYTSRPYVFSNSEMTLLRSLGSQTASAVINTRLYEEQVAAERFQRQVKTAGEIQRRMLPKSPPDHPGLDFGKVYIPTLQVGGDFFDFIELPDGHLGVCIADVVGKGLPAALMMASVRAAWRVRATGVDDLEATVSAVNRHMSRDTLVGEFATVFYGVFSPDGRSLAYCNAGHPPPLLLRGDQLDELSVGGLVLGVDPDAAFVRGTRDILPGDIIVMTTDGVTEAMDFEGQAFGNDRLVASIRKHRALGAEQLAQQLLWDVRRFAGLADQSDDITIVVVKAV